MEIRNATFMGLAFRIPNSTIDYLAEKGGTFSHTCNN